MTVASNFGRALALQIIYDTHSGTSYYIMLLRLEPTVLGTFDAIAS